MIFIYCFIINGRYNILAIKKAEDLGFKIVGHSDAKPWWKEAFFHPKESLNIVVQIVESDESVKNENAWNINWSKFSEFDKVC